MPTITPVQFFETLYPDPELPGRLILWTKSRRGGKIQTTWTHQLDQAARLAHRYRHSRDVYFGVALQDRERALAIARRRRPRAREGTVRGSEASATVLPAVFADLDVAGPEHKSGDLPPDRKSALGLLDAIPKKPSVVVDSGAGFHVYWLLREPWVLATEEDRVAAKLLLRRVQAALQAAARERGWGVDNTADLARLLRVPGTLHHKSSPSRPVTVEHFPLTPNGADWRAADWRYVPDDFAKLPAPVALPRSAGRLLRGAPTDNRPPADFRCVYEGCGWMRHCYDDRTRLPEPEWYAALSIIGRCAVDGVDGRRLAHRMSRDHPGYSPIGTDEKLDHALETSGPRTCAHIAGLGSAVDYCGTCVHRGRIKSPILLGRRSPATRLAPPGTASPGTVSPGTASPETASLKTASLKTASLKTASLKTLPAAPGTRQAPPMERAGEPDGRPEILITTREDTVNDQALSALAAREPNLYQRAGILVQIVSGELGAGNSGRLDKPPVASSVKPLVEARLRELLARHCAFVKPSPARRGGGSVTVRPAHPPRWTVRALLGRGTWPELPALAGLVEGPVLRRDGSVLQKPGFDRRTGLVYLPGGEFEPVPEAPDQAATGAALARLREVVCDFPFRTEAHFSAWLSSLLTPLARPAFDGPSPLNLIDANIRGVGKSLLADVCSVILTGRPAARMSYSHDEEEIRKQITSLALEASQLALIDNVSGVFGSPTLDRALTADSWRDRLLGSNHQVSMPLRITWYATGNNLVLKGDTPRRCVHIRLESRRDAPECRTGFRHPRLLQWIASERRRLLPAALTLLRAYAAAGFPPQRLTGWGSYEGWSDLVRSTIVWLGLVDPAVTREALEASADGDKGALLDLVHGLCEVLTTLGGEATSNDVLAELAAERSRERYGVLRAALCEIFPRLRRGELPTATQLSMKMGSVRGRIVGGACIEQGSRTYKGVLWSVRNTREVA